MLEAARELCLRFEGFRAEPYLCPAGIPTIGIGTTHYPNGRKVTMTDQPITKEYALELLDVELIRAMKAVRKLVKVPITENQLNALVDFVYNLGAGKLQASTLLRKLNRGENPANEFDKWVYAGGVKMAGLIKRREAEKQLFLKVGSLDG